MKPAFRILQVVLVLLIFISVTFAQEVSTNEELSRGNTANNSSQRGLKRSPNGIEAQNDIISFKNENSTSIILITEETNQAASILFYDQADFNGIHKKLSNSDGNLYWGSDKIGIDNGNSSTFSVGDFINGGVVFWLDESGKHGLVCAKLDQNGGNTIRWYAGTHGVTRARGDGPFSGEMNTNIIIASQVAIGDDGSSYAAQVCSDLVISEGGKSYGDWYLPSKEELNLMYLNQTTINNTAISNGGSSFSTDNQNYYWSSTEDTGGNAWIQYMNSGNQFSNFKSSPRYIRAIRAF